ncbi:MAG: M50 family metallopeptidase [Verrucomicrobia bacterium]|nr:M50 family metallopeptidase [Verrucomicrobiota bacterium]
MACGLMIVAAIYLSIFIHEFGHWLFGKACGFRIVGFSVGEGRMLWRGKMGGGFVHLRLFPTEGYVVAVKESAPVTKTQDFLVSAGGPIFTALTFACVGAAYRWGNFTVLGETWSVLAWQMLAITMVLLGIDLLYNLWPQYGSLSGAPVSNDGMRMLRALLSKTYPRPHWYQAQLRAAFHDGEETSESQAPNFKETAEARTLLLKASIHHWDNESELALMTADETLQLPGLTPQEQALILNEAASFAPQTKAGLDLALEYRERAYALFPKMDSFACELAWTQIRLRFYDRGRAILEEVLERSQDNDTRATALCILALADASQNRREDGIKRTQEARKLSPFCPMLPVARAALFGGTAEFNTNR